MHSTKNELPTIVAAFFIIYFVWGATYLANAWGLESFSPFLLAGIRFTISGILMIVYSWFKGNLKVSKSQLKNVSLAGFLFFTLGNGCVVWGLQFVDSGITALIIALQPLNVALLLWFMKGEKPVLMGWLGLLLGMIGMVLLVGQPEFINDVNWMMGLGSIYIGIISWAYVSIKMSSLDMPQSIILSAGLQMIIGGIFSFIISFFQGELTGFEIDQVTLRAFYSLLFLIVFGSIIAFTAFNYLLLKVSPFKVSTGSYVNPIVALYLGWLLNNEQISTKTLIASAFLLGAVVLINMGKLKSKPTK